VEGLGPATWVEVGFRFTCAIVSESAFCWGSNEFGQLGDMSASRTDAHPTPLKVYLQLRTPIQICAGARHACALMSTGEVQCWGSNDEGQLGLPLSITSSSYPTTVISSGVSRIACNLQDTCALTADGTLKCWGNPAPEVYSQSTGFANAKDLTYDGGPCLISSDNLLFCRYGGVWKQMLDAVEQVSGGYVHHCAIRRGIGGTAYCWEALGQTPMRIPGY
jgi:hypothetical protein